MIDPKEAEKFVYDWCTCESRGTTSARALAAIYASAYLDQVLLLRFVDLRTLDDIRLEWAMALIQGYVEGQLNISWPRAVVLVALYDLIPLETEF